MRKLIDELSAINGISGREAAVRGYIQAKLEDAPAVSEIRTDPLGNCIVSLKGTALSERKVVFAAHMDEVGGIITAITADGYLRMDTVGGINNDVLFGKTVWINGHAGVIGGKAVHQCKGDEKQKVPAIGALHIDIGADNEAQARMVAQEGDAVTFSDNRFQMNGESFCAKALDDRVGCAMLLALAHTQPKYDATLIFTVQEEIGTRGATTAAFALQPDIAVVVDATTACDIPSVSEDNQVTQLGKGPVVSFMDRSTMYDSELYQDIRALATANNIPTQTKTKIAGGNDSRAFQTTGIGARVASVSLPCRYIHSPTCVLNQTDVENTYRLLELLLNRLPSGETLV